jgi:hypothetical protein
MTYLSYNMDTEIGCRVYKDNILQYDLNDNLIKVWDSIKQAESDGGFSSNKISLCCNRKNITYMGYIWVSKPVYKQQKLLMKCYEKKLCSDNGIVVISDIIVKCSYINSGEMY